MKKRDKKSDLLGNKTSSREKRKALKLLAEMKEREKEKLKSGLTWVRDGVRSFKLK